MELWQPINKSEKHFISNYGRVKTIHPKGRITYSYGYPMTKRGYLVKSIYGKCIYVHRLVAIAFILNEHHKPQVNHKDGDILNNHSDNLEWSTARQNILHSYRIGTSKVGEERHNTTLTNNQVLEIRKRCAFGMSAKQISCILNINYYTVNSIIKNRNYKTITL